MFTLWWSNYQFYKYEISILTDIVLEIRGSIIWDRPFKEECPTLLRFIGLDGLWKSSLIFCYYEIINMKKKTIRMEVLRNLFNMHSTKLYSFTQLENAS